MRARLTDDRGFTLVELVIVSSLFLMILAATLGGAASFERLSSGTQKVNMDLDRARRGLDRSMRQLRNLARRIDAPVIQRANRSDFIFQTSDPAKTWVRTCLETRSTGRIWLWSSNTPSAVTEAMSGPCPGTGWARSDLIAQNVTNYEAGRDLPLFSYSCVQGAATGCPASAEDFGRITSVRMDLLIDDDLTRAPRESRVSSAVYLRNQNEPPTASFTAQPLASRQVLLNASASSDPEGRTLRFMWFRGPAPTFTCDQQPPAGTILWQGVTMPHTFLDSEGAAGTQRPIELVVCDPGDLQARLTSQVTIP